MDSGWLRPDIHLLVPHGQALGVQEPPHQLHRAQGDGAYLVESGMTPMGVILAGTSEAAELLGPAHETGTLETGKRAGLVIARGNPLTGIASLGKPENVLLVAEDGVPYKDTDGLAA
ncbi:amidohydrolase family protein [Streptomyces sp. NPDC056696]|uniref:amidohydrolase family protein n=1 Tax=unclassified Streptomyces TaxID=2593676 RepID=UPI0036771FA9